MLIANKACTTSIDSVWTCDLCVDPNKITFDDVLSPSVFRLLRVPAPLLVRFLPSTATSATPTALTTAASPNIRIAPLRPKLAISSTNHTFLN
jgi:hypothetical protein